MGVIQNITYEDFKQIQRVAGVGSWEYDIISNRNYKKNSKRPSDRAL
jgi:hypothetical protein